MSSNAPQPLSDDPAPVNFWVEHYKDTCETYVAENVHLKGEVALLKRRHLEDVEEIDRLKGVIDQLEDVLRRQRGQSCTPSRATTSEREIGLRTPPSSSKGTFPALNARRARAPDASESPQEEDGESSSDDENLADAARRIRAGGGRVGQGQSREQRQARRVAQQERIPHPIRWGPKLGAKKENLKGKQTRKRDAPDESSDSDTPLANRRNLNRRTPSSSKKMRLEGVFPPPLRTEERSRHTPVSSAPPPSSITGPALADSSEEEEDEEDAEDEEDEGAGEEEDDVDDLFSLTSLTPVSSRPSSPLPVDPVVLQESTAPREPHLPGEPRQPEASSPTVRHFRSPSRELSYFDPIPQRHVPTPPPPEGQLTQPSARESQVETSQIASRQASPACPPAGPLDSDINPLSVLGNSWSFTSRAMAGLAADPLDLHPFSVAARSQPFPLRHFSFLSVRSSTSASASTSCASRRPPPPEASLTPQVPRPLDTARNRQRQAAPRNTGASTLSGSGSRLPLSLPPGPATAPPRTTTLATPYATSATVATAPRPIAIIPTSSPTTTRPAVIAPQATALPFSTVATGQPIGPIPPPTATALPRTAIPSPTTAPLITAPAPTIAPPSTTAHPFVPAATQSSGLQTSGASLPSSTSPAQPEAGPSQPSKGYTTSLLPGTNTKIGPPLLSENALTARLAQVPGYHIVADDSLLDLRFTREFISQTIGGSSKWKYTTSRDGRPLLFGNPTFNSHLPESPGFPGLLCHANDTPDWKEEDNWLFLEVASAQHWYMGIYKLKKPASVPKEEYNAWPLEMKRKWAEDILMKTKHREIRWRIVRRRERGHEQDKAPDNTDVDDYKNLTRDEIIEAYELGHETMHMFPMECVGYDVALMRDAAERLPTYLARRAEQNAARVPQASANEAARPAT